MELAAIGNLEIRLQTQPLIIILVHDICLIVKTAAQIYHGLAPPFCNSLITNTQKHLPKN